MGRSGILDDIDNLVTFDDSLDNILDSISSLNENLEEDDLSEGNWAAKFQSLVPIPSEDISGLRLPSGGNNGNGALNAAWNVSVPKRQQKFAKGTFDSRTQLQSDCSSGLESAVSQTPSPGSVLESSSSSIVEKSMPISSDSAISRCSRSKRLRFPPFNRWLEIPPSSVASRKSHQLAASKAFSQLEHYSDLHLPRKMSDGVETKPSKKKKTSEVSGTSFVEKNSLQQAIAPKKCTHCKVTKTPQWRMGPMGPQTLCNACGVRYRSGRLFPEYRPAASPAFVPSLHSNLHREVIKIRDQASQKTLMTEMNPEMLPPQENRDMSPPPEFIPMSSFLFDSILESTGRYS